ncbi:glycosyltransferase family 4 protein [Loktanella sp. DJP18]|uniref:glycosyltransferase family 4 protein n=1 Tax=Loktanella sp. DJP18 TaxID=3409788 RepID=UPI003BB4DADC
MTLVYLMNTYPLISTTFVRREIHAHETAGVPVARFAIRPWGQPLVDPLDRAELARTIYLLGPGLLRLALGGLREAVLNPAGLARALATTLHLATRRGGTGARNFVYLLEAVRFKRMARAAGVTHVHAHFSTNAAAVALLSRRMGGPAYSFTAHGPDEFDDTEANGLRVKVRHAAFVAAITNYARGVISTATGGRHDDKIHVVRCGIDLEAFDPLPPADNARIVCVGRLCPAKAQGLLVEAIAPLVGDHPDLQLVFVGDGEDRAGIEARVRTLGLGSHVTLAGWGTGDDVRTAIAAARVLALPSDAEGLPIVLMEALAMGRPVITTRITGIPELVDDGCGWVVTPGSVPELTAAIAAALATPPATLQDMAAEGRRRVARNHDQAVNAARLRLLFGHGYAE